MLGGANMIRLVALGGDRYAAVGQRQLHKGKEAAHYEGLLVAFDAALASSVTYRHRADIDSVILQARRAADGSLLLVGDAVRTDQSPPGALSHLFAASVSAEGACLAAARSGGPSPSPPISAWSSTSATASR